MKTIPDSGGKSRPSDKGGEGGHPDPEIRGEPQSPKNFLQPLGPQFGLKIIREAGGPSHGSTTRNGFCSQIRMVRDFCNGAKLCCAVSISKVDGHILDRCYTG